MEARGSGEIGLADASSQGASPRGPTNCGLMRVSSTCLLEKLEKTRLSCISHGQKPRESDMRAPLCTFRMIERNTHGGQDHCNNCDPQASRGRPRRRSRDPEETS